MHPYHTTEIFLWYWHKWKGEAMDSKSKQMIRCAYTYFSNITRMFPFRIPQILNQNIANALHWLHKCILLHSITSFFIWSVYLTFCFANIPWGSLHLVAWTCMCDGMSTVKRHVCRCAGSVYCFCSFLFLLYFYNQCSFSFTNKKTKHRACCRCLMYREHWVWSL